MLKAHSMLALFSIITVLGAELMKPLRRCIPLLFLLPLMKLFLDLCYT